MKNSTQEILLNQNYKHICNLNNILKTNGYLLKEENSKQYFNKENDNKYGNYNNNCKEKKFKMIDFINLNLSNKNNICNKENNKSNGNISSIQKCSNYDCKILKRKIPKKYNNNSNFHSHLINKNINENIYNNKNIYKKSLKRNINKKNLSFNNFDCLITENGKRKKNKNLVNKINFNEDCIKRKYCSTINIFKNNKVDDLNSINNNKEKLQLHPSKKIKNIKQVIYRKNNYLNNLDYHNNTYIEKINRIINTNFICDNNIKYKNNKQGEKLESNSRNNKMTKKIGTRKERIKCFNNEEDNKKKNKIIKIYNRNKKQNKLCTNNKNLKNTIFNFERLSKHKETLNQNTSEIYVDKFFNEDGTKDDITYKIMKTKYLSPKINIINDKIHYLSNSKNKKSEYTTGDVSNRYDKDKLKNIFINRFDKFESNIEYSKSLLNNIKLDSANNSNENIMNNYKNNDEINYFKIENDEKNVNRNKMNNLINSIPIRNKQKNYLFRDNKIKSNTINKENIINDFKRNFSINEGE